MSVVSVKVRSSVVVLAVILIQKYNVVVSIAKEALQKQKHTMSKDSSKKKIVIDVLIAFSFSQYKMLKMFCVTHEWALFLLMVTFK